MPVSQRQRIIAAISIVMPALNKGTIESGLIRSSGVSVHCKSNKYSLALLRP